MDRLCITEDLPLFLCCLDFHSVLRKHRMNGSDNRHVRSEHAVITDCNRSIILHDEVEIGEEIPSDFRVHSVMKEYRVLQNIAFSELSEKRGDYTLPLLRIRLKCAVVLDIQSVCPALLLHKFRCLCIEQYSCVDSVFFVHVYHLFHLPGILPSHNVRGCQSFTFQ